MRVIIVGLGIQGAKRLEVAKSDVVATVDPVNSRATHKRVEDINLADYDAAILCTPDSHKIQLIKYLLENQKHVMVEKPLFAENNNELLSIKKIAIKNEVSCYTAYNHRFEPHFIRMKELIDSGLLGKIYTVRMFYGNGTARLVRESPWRDSGDGVMSDLGSHLLDTPHFFLGDFPKNFELYSGSKFENKSFDHVVFGCKSEINIQLEATLLSWRNHFTCDVLAENGSAHIESLCKWGPSKFTYRIREIPSGRPRETSTILTNPDPTWKSEYLHFKNLCKNGLGNIDNDIHINDILKSMRS